MTELWFCPYCGGGNEATKVTCIGCGNRMIEDDVVDWEDGLDYEDEEYPVSPYFMNGGASVQSGRTFNAVWGGHARVSVPEAIERITDHQSLMSDEQGRKIIDEIEEENGVKSRMKRTFKSIWGDN